MLLSRKKIIVLKILLGLLFFYSCNQEKKNIVVRDLSGSWYSYCNSNYIEYHFTKNHVIGFMEDAIGLTYVFPYSTLNDTLFAYNDIEKKFYALRFTLYDNNNRLIIYSMNGVKVEYMKFSEYSVFPLEGCDLYGSNLDSLALKHYEYMFLKRKIKFNCSNVVE